jgi:hypothetical protein
VHTDTPDPPVPAQKLPPLKNQRPEVSDNIILVLPRWGHAVQKNSRVDVKVCCAISSSIMWDLKLLTPASPQTSSTLTTHMRAHLIYQGLRPPYPTHYHHTAARQIQRCFRGWAFRRRFWRFHAPGTQLMATRMQRAARGFLGRRRAGAEARRQLDHRVAQIQAMYWGFKARQHVR